MKNKFFITCSLILLLTVIAFLLKNILFNDLHDTPFTNDTSSEKVQVVTSFYPIYFFASQIGGEKAQVQNITPAGSEPHEYELTSKDMTDIEKSELLVMQGGLEPWENNIKKNLEGKNIFIVTTGQNLLTKFIEDDGKKNLDPHIWLSPILAKEVVKKIANGFIHIDPQNRSYYEKNAAVLDGKLTQLDEEFMSHLSDCRLHDFVTSHAAFGYLAERYGLNQIAISGISPESEPSARQLANVAKIAKEKQVKYIFFESLVSPKLSETIASEIGADTLVLDPLEGLSDDDINEGKNYFTIMQDNLKNLKLALQCIK